MMWQSIDAKLILTKKKNNLEYTSMCWYTGYLLWGLIYWKCYCSLYDNWRAKEKQYSLLQQAEINWIHFASLYPEFF